MDAISGGGVFWTPEDPDVRVRGEFTARVGQKLEVTLERALPTAPASFPPFEPGDMAGFMRAHAAISIARSAPTTIWGQLDSGALVSAFEGHSQGDRERPRYDASTGVLGAHVTRGQLYGAVRFLLDDPRRLSHLRDNESCVIEEDQSELHLKASDEGNWLAYTSSTPATLRELDHRVVSGCLALAQLALFPDRERDLVTRQMQVRVDPNGPWLNVLGPAFWAEPHEVRPDTLLPHAELTVDRFAKWIALNDTFDGLAWAVARRLQVPLQLQVQLLTSLVEGFHRRLKPPRDQTWFPDAEKAALKRVRDAAVQAAVDQAHREGLDPQVMGTRVMSALGQLGDKSFGERADEIVAKVCAAVPELAVSITRLAAHITDPRHDFAHQLPQNYAKVPFENRVDRWMVVSALTPWLLRVLLLLEVGVEPEVLREKCLENEYFAFYRENAERRVRELGWDKAAAPKPAPRAYTPTVMADLRPPESGPSQVTLRQLVEGAFAVVKRALRCRNK